jgi:CelD/BcsL family acetyltransferase involved in cellulose biosynthesis
VENCPVTCRLLQGFQDARLVEAQWEELVSGSQTQSVFQSRAWNQTWWENYGRGKLVLVAAERNGDPIALAPLFADGGMLFFVGSGGSDYLDFLGDTSDPCVLTQLLAKAREEVVDFAGFRFYHVRDESRTAQRLSLAAGNLGLVCFEEESIPAPTLDMRDSSEQVRAAVEKKSLLRHERHFRKSGELLVEHLQGGAEISAHLDDFFDQHRRRWAGTDSPSLFCSPQHCAFYRRLAETADRSQLLRFTRLSWNGNAIAYHFGFYYRGVYMWYKPSFEVELARRSPGEVLLRELLLAAIEERASEFDFGLGDEPFKHRFATHQAHVRTWGLYPSELCRRGNPSEAG